MYGNETGIIYEEISLEQDDEADFELVSSRRVNKSNDNIQIQTGSRTLAPAQLTSNTSGHTNATSQSRQTRSRPKAAPQHTSNRSGHTRSRNFQISAENNEVEGTTSQSRQTRSRTKAATQPITNEMYSPETHPISGKHFE